MELKQIDSILLKSLYLITMGIVMTQVLGMDTLTSLLFYLTFPLTVVLWLRSVRRTLTSSDGIMLLAAGLAVINVLLNAGITGTRLSFEYLKKTIMFIMTLMFLQTANRLRIHENMVRFIGGVASILAIFFGVAFYILGEDAYLLNGYRTHYLTFNFTNSNTTGMFLLCVYILVMHRLIALERWYTKLIHLVLAGLLAWFICLTRSRNSILVMAIYTVIHLWLIFRSAGKRMRVGKLWAFLASIVPAVFVGLYMLFVSTDWIQNIFGFLVGEGKGLDSRMKIWVNALKHLRQSPLIGAYSQLSHGDGSFHMHNTHLDIACSYGIAVLVLVCVLLYRYFHQGGYRYSDKASYCYMLGFICAVLLGIGEAAMFSGGLGVYIFIGSLLLLSNSKTAEER